MDARPLQILHYPHPALRYTAKPLRRVDAELRGMVGQMFALMYEHKGIGLAATQVGLPYRLFVLNLKSDPAEQEQEHVFINPIINKRKGTSEAEEGCLSLPEVYGDVKRAENVALTAYTLSGEEVTMDLEGLFARAVQHELDHLDGVLFIDRLSETSRMDVNEALEEFEVAFAGRRQRGEIPSDEQIRARLAELERLRT